LLGRLKRLERRLAAGFFPAAPSAVLRNGNIKVAKQDETDYLNDLHDLTKTICKTSTISGESPAQRPPIRQKAETEAGRYEISGHSEVMWWASFSSFDTSRKPGVTPPSWKSAFSV
jgi:hypothetical protein